MSLPASVVSVIIPVYNDVEGDGNLAHAPAAAVKHPARSSFAEIPKRDQRVQRGSIILRR